MSSSLSSLPPRRGGIGIGIRSGHVVDLMAMAGITALGLHGDISGTHALGGILIVAVGRLRPPDDKPGPGAGAGAPGSGLMTSGIVGSVMGIVAVVARVLERFGGPHVST